MEQLGRIWSQRHLSPYTPSGVRRRFRRGSRWVQARRSNQGKYIEVIVDPHVGNGIYLRTRSKRQGPKVEVDDKTVKFRVLVRLTFKCRRH